MTDQNHFQTIVELGGKTATGLRVPDEIVDAMGKGKRPPVIVTIGNHSYRSTVAVMGGAYMLPLSAENRELANVSAGELVSVTLAYDPDPREVTVPDDLRAAFSESPTAKEAFEALSYSLQRRYVLSIDDAKTDETRRRRIAKTIETLTGS